MGNELLLEAFEVEVSAVAEELAAVFLVAEVDGVAAEEAEDLREVFGGAVGDFGGKD